MKTKTADLIGPALDWAVSKCLQPGYEEWRLIRWIEQEFAPTANWAQGGPIIEREELGLKRNAPCSQGREWEASPSITAKGAGGKWGYGPTPLVAAMRCFVASKLGDEVDVPEELL